MEPTNNNNGQQQPAGGVSPLQPVQPQPQAGGPVDQVAEVVPTPAPTDQPASDSGRGVPASPVAPSGEGQQTPPVA
ncbi:MAG: hypothetical protein A2782_02225 [Candidatus Blackburnbacteria bacterium RIFCSPHIGHO2_01_FULL_43_15b]|uniref:Uncharacterized protein n=1 Tax=Candidatus Blackburnbacteria bacterium RIFCSPHIGHO2_01_FULL_43_15b TaxID=1797513 RepID=A0A1G1V069_9BACT|nr:MAG: hypothetical protein A2782_02225 [Candidatus Blackburnbacteria bacterium RIFCSPHIGHO2_01_FULL_43_15b]